MKEEENLIMAVVTEAFDIPMDIMTKLATGEYRRLGGVVRVAIGPNKGQIVKHLDCLLYTSPSPRDS